MNLDDCNFLPIVLIISVAPVRESEGCHCCQFSHPPAPPPTHTHTPTPKALSLCQRGNKRATSLPREVLGLEGFFGRLPPVIYEPWQALTPSVTCRFRGCLDSVKICHEASDSLFRELTALDYKASQDPHSLSLSIALGIAESVGVAYVSFTSLQPSLTQGVTQGNVTVSPVCLAGGEPLPSSRH